MKAKIKISEHALQASCFDWVRIMEKTDVRFKMIHSVPNGAWFKNIAQAVKLKKEGLRSGIFDMIVDVPMRGFHGLRLEFKTEKGTLSDEQKKRGELYTHFGYAWSVIRTFEQFRSVITAYFQKPYEPL